tara:strand:+ start:895 stop:1182 length:288 start_codon:yes stop_codon:yes gene_type:complete
MGLELNDLWLLLIMFSIMGAGFTLFYYVTLKPTWAFFDKCNDLEKHIREKDDQDYQLRCLYKLEEFSWHRSTGERLRELALMMEVKYNIQILKRR